MCYLFIIPLFIQQIFIEGLLCARNFMAVITAFLYLCYAYDKVQGYCVYLDFNGDHFE